MTDFEAEQFTELVRERDALKVALVKCAIPYEAIRMDAGSRKWIAPEIWNAIIAATDEARALVCANDRKGG